jgi:predicted tellurium resistance membrane protein TerC
MGTFMRLAADPTAWVALATLVVMEVVLGIERAHHGIWPLRNG